MNNRRRGPLPQHKGREAERYADSKIMGLRNRTDTAARLIVYGLALYAAGALTALAIWAAAGI